MEQKKKIEVVDDSKKNEDDGKKIKGIKCVPKRKGRGSSVRPKSALEKATKKKSNRSNKSTETVQVLMLLY